ncbi:MAG: Panacea domain-containing protein [Candidatus Xenobia bacterium]
MTRVVPDDAKFKALVLYVAHRCQFMENFGATKLNKILFYSDFLAYRRTGKPITGQEYQKQPNGPTARRMLPLLAELVESKQAVMQRKEIFDYQEDRLIPLAQPELTRLFTAEEIALVDQVIEWLGTKTAKWISHRSHAGLGWRVVDFGETIPYQTALIERRPLSKEDRDHALKLADELQKA